MATVQATVIDPAFRVLGVQSTAANYSTLVANALVSLNQLVEDWNMRDGRLFRQAQTVVTLPSGGNNLSLADLSLTGLSRPNMIVAVSAWSGAQTGTLAYPLRPASMEEWQIWPSTAPYVNGMPTAWREEYVSSTLWHLWFYPVPTTNTSVNITYKAVLTDTMASSDTIDFPRGYARALKYNLAVDLSPEYGGSVLSADMDRIERIARESVRGIERMNDRPAGRVRLDPALTHRTRGGPSIYAGTRDGV